MTSRLRQLMLIASGSLIFAAVKTALVWILDAWTIVDPWLNYLIVTSAITIFGWLYHSRVSFKLPLNRQTLLRYVQQAAALKAFDYCLYSTLVYLVGASPSLAVVATSGVVFGVRVAVYMKFVFAQPGSRRGTWSDATTVE